MTFTQPNPAPGFAKHPEHRLDLDQERVSLEVAFGGEIVAATKDALVLRESNYPPRYYVPLTDVRMQFLEPSPHRTTCPFKGEARYWSVVAGDRRTGNSVWAYEAPYDEMLALAGHVAFDEDRMDRFQIAAPT